MKLLVTGGFGFIGSNFVRWVLSNRPELELVNLDRMTYAGNRENLRSIEGDVRHRFVQADLADPGVARQALAGCDAAVHFAAETHVDRSIQDAGEFLRTNLLGTHLLLEAARRQGVKRYLQISTDEVYGSLLEGAATEESPLRPNSPYAASKAGADHLVRAYQVTYGLPALILRASNNYGPYQFPEKFIPLMITNALEEEPLPIYGDGLHVREWLFVEDFCEAIALLLEKGQPGEIYNVGSGIHCRNLEIVERVLARLGKPKELIRHVEDRLGHDRRYAVDSSKIRRLGWRPSHPFQEGLEQTIDWYRRNEEWWRPLRRVKGEG